jgi:hypothetical protein
MIAGGAGKRGWLPPRDQEAGGLFVPEVFWRCQYCLDVDALAVPASTLPLWQFLWRLSPDPSELTFWCVCDLCLDNYEADPVGFMTRAREHTHRDDLEVPVLFACRRCNDTGFERVSEEPPTVQRCACRQGRKVKHKLPIESYHHGVGVPPREP